MSDTVVVTTDDTSGDDTEAAREHEIETAQDAAVAEVHADDAEVAADVADASADQATSAASAAITADLEAQESAAVAAEAASSANEAAYATQASVDQLATSIDGLREILTKKDEQESPIEQLLDAGDGESESVAPRRTFGHRWLGIP